MQDITKYSDNELSLIVMINEHLYNFAMNRQFKEFALFS